MFCKTDDTGGGTALGYRHVRLNLAVLAAGLVFCATVLSFAVPLVLSFVPLFSSRFDFSHLTGAVHQNGAQAVRRIFRIASFTVGQAFFSSLAATVIGLQAAYFCAKKDFAGRRLLLALSGIPLCVPAVIIALAFIVFFGNNGMVNSVLKRLLNTGEPVIKFLFTMKGVVLVHAFYNFPIAMRTISQTWERLSDDEEHAAVLLGAGRVRIFKTITFPALFNSVAASFLLIFLFCFFSFIIILLFGGLGSTTLEVELYKTFRGSLNINLAAKISLVEMTIAGALIVLYAGLQKRLSGENLRLKPIGERTALKGVAERLMFAGMVSVIGFFLIAPLCSIFWRSVYDISSGSFFSFKAWREVLVSRVFRQAFTATVAVGLCTACVTLATSLFFAYLTFFSRLKKIAFAVPYLPLAVSSIMQGFGWTLLQANGSVLILIAAQSALAWPFAWTQIQTSLSRVPETVLNAAFLFSSDKKDAFFRCFVPLCKGGVFSAFGFVFAISAGDASLPIVLNIPRFQNLALLLFDYSSSYRFAQSAAVAVVLAVLTGFVFLLQEKDEKRRRKNGAKYRVRFFAR